MTRQQSELLERASESVLERLLRRSTRSISLAAHAGEPSDPEAVQLVAALGQIASLLRDALAKEGLERIDTAEVAFDPTIHDAVARDPAGEGDEGARGHRGGDLSPRVPVEGASGSDRRWSEFGAERVAPQREWFETDYYKVLGVSQGATDKEITRALPEAREAVPPGREPRFGRPLQEISAAYDVLGDAAKRKEYDDVRRLGPAAAGFGGGGGGFDFKVEDFSDLFGGIFNNRRSGRRPPGTWSATRRRPRGGAPSLLPGGGGRCSHDRERGEYRPVRDVFRVGLQARPRCRSSALGVGGAERSTTTRDSSLYRRRARNAMVADEGSSNLARPASVRASTQGASGEGPDPAGVADAQRIKVKGRGEAGRNGGPGGDLYVTVTVAPHPLFGRRGADLTLTVPLTFAEAALGSEITVPSLDRPVTLRIPAERLRARSSGSEGADSSRERSSVTCSVTVDVIVPAELSDDERKAIEAYAAASTTSPRSHLGV